MSRRTNLLSLLAGLALAASAWADVPAALDRVPADAMAVVAVPSIAALHDSLTLIQDSLGIPAEAMNLPLDAFQIKGLNSGGSAAVAIIPGPEFDPSQGEPPMVAVVPVNDYASFVTALGGVAGGVSEVTVNGEAAFLKDVGGGYAALSPDKAILDGFAGKGGSMGAFRQTMGPAGLGIAEKAEVILIANLQKISPLMREKIEEFKQNIAMAGAMTGQDMGPATAMIESLSEAITRDGQTSVVGLDVAQAGVTFSTAAQFKEGSPTAQLFNDKGRSGTLLNALPAQPFMLAFAMDTSGAGMKKLMAGYAQVQKAAGGGIDLLGAGASEGQSMIIGASPALMGAGMLINSAVYYRTADPAAFVGTLRQAATDLNGKQTQGMTLQTSFEPESATVAGAKVDSYSVRAQMDPNSPAAQQMQMMMMMLFGPTGGPAGYIARTEGGVITTFSKNSALVEQCMKAGRGENSLGSHEQIRAVSANLPADRTFEGYVGVKEILSTVMGALAMFMGPVEFEVPEKVSPIGMAATTHGGGVSFGMFMAMDTLNTFKSLGEAFEKAQGGGEDAPPAPGANPRF